MSIIEGVGDEVIQFFGIVLLIFLGVLAWWSTNIRDVSQIRTVLIVESRSQNVTTHQPNLLSTNDRLDSGQSDGAPCRNNLSGGENKDSANNLPLSSNVNANKDAPQTSSNDTLKRKDDKSSANSGSSTHSVKQEAKSGGSDTNNMRIRLKYLNDEQKLVEGRKQELLGDFKRRHFEIELSAHKLVRLIFNGQVLQRDDQTLAGCGLYDNCVVHCLVQQQSAVPGARPAATTQRSGTSIEWNLDWLLKSCICLILGIAWLCWYNYPQLFTLTSTTSLVGLTGIFAVSIVGHFMRDRETQDPPANTFFSVTS